MSDQPRGLTGHRLGGDDRLHRPCHPGSSCQLRNCSTPASGCGLRQSDASLTDLIARVWDGMIDTGKVFDLTLPLDQVADAFRAMDERRAIKVLLGPDPGPVPRPTAVCRPLSA